MKKTIRRPKKKEKPPSDPFLTEVLKTAKRGWPVHPLKGKVPILTNWPTVATTDKDKIVEWRKTYPKANWGGVAGKRSGCFVLDVDPRHGGDDSLRDLEGKHSPLPNTVEVITGSGGHHYYFQYPGPDILNSAGVLGPGLDIKTDRGQVVIPPSIHPETGRAYEWDAAHHPDDVNVAPAPPWLLDALKAARKKQKSDQQTGEKIAKGERNDFLAREAGRLRLLLSKAELEEALLVINRERCEPPLPDKEVRAIAASIAQYPAIRFTDVGNGEQFAQQHHDTARYCYPWRKWLVWNGQRWKPDDGGQVMLLAKATAHSWYVLASRESDEVKRKLLSRWAIESERKHRLENMLFLAQSEPGMAIAVEALDTDPMLLNVATGTVDLRTGTLRPPRREDFITKMVGVAFRPEAACPVFMGLLARLFDTVPAIREYLQRIFGYALTGDTSEQCFFIFYGTGSNGKSTVLRAILDLMGEYATTTRPETFLTKRGDGIPNDVAALAGARFVLSLESEQGKRLAEGLVKGMTGGDKLSARFLNREFFEFVPQLKLFIGTNHKPTITGTDHAMWRRVRSIPFSVVIPDDEQDKHLSEKLRAEYDGILRWIIEGCLMWQRDGLGPPLEVQAATAAYREEQDSLGAFLRDETCCALDLISTAGPSVVTCNAGGRGLA